MRSSLRRGGRLRLLPRLLGFGWVVRVLPHGFGAPFATDHWRRASGGRGAERRAAERRWPARPLHGKGRDWLGAGRVPRHLAGHPPARDHCGRRGAARHRRALPRPRRPREVPIAILNHRIHPVIAYLGSGALLAGLVLGGFSALLSFWAGWRENTLMVQVGRRAFYASAAMTLFAAALLEVALLT